VGSKVLLDSCVYSRIGVFVLRGFWTSHYIIFHVGRRVRRLPTLKRMTLTESVVNKQQTTNFDSRSADEFISRTPSPLAAEHRVVLAVPWRNTPSAHLLAIRSPTKFSSGVFLKRLRPIQASERTYSLCIQFPYRMHLANKFPSKVWRLCRLDTGCWLYFRDEMKTVVRPDWSAL